MQELINKMTFMVVTGAINDQIKVEMVGGYEPCKQYFEKLKKENERCFLVMLVNKWNTK